jgi:hypothetical protein
MEPTTNVPTFKTFVNSEPKWKAAFVALMAALSEATSLSLGARKAAQKILKEPDCGEMRTLYRQSALKYFPRTLKETEDPQMQEDAVAITRAYDLRKQNSCSRGNRERTHEEPNGEEKEEEEEHEETEEEEAEETEEENPAYFSDGNAVYSWVKTTIVGVGFVYAAKQVSAPGGGRPLPCPRSPRHQ